MKGKMRGSIEQTLPATKDSLVTKATESSFSTCHNQDEEKNHNNAAKRNNLIDSSDDPSTEAETHCSSKSVAGDMVGELVEEGALRLDEGAWSPREDDPNGEPPLQQVTFKQEEEVNSETPRDNGIPEFIYIRCKSEVPENEPLEPRRRRRGFLVQLLSVFGGEEKHERLTEDDKECFQQTLVEL
jgi:hypothetical protein